MLIRFLIRLIRKELQMNTQEQINQITASLTATASVLAAVQLPTPPDLTNLTVAANSLTDAVNKLVANTTTPVA
jgi:hypothetical protein